MRTTSMASLLVTAAGMLGCATDGAISTPKADREMTRSVGVIIPFDSGQWSFSGNARPETYLGQEAVHLGFKQADEYISFGAATLGGLDFGNGVIEYDIAFDGGQQYPGVDFRQGDGGNHERFYMRPHQSGEPDANSYIPVFNGVQSWQLYSGEAFSSPKEYVLNEWQHVKIVVSDNLADVYLGDMREPELTIELRHENKSGAISLSTTNVHGNVHFANFAVHHQDNLRIEGSAIMDTPATEGTVLSWAVSDAFAWAQLDGKTELTDRDRSDRHYTWLESDINGLTNLAKVQGTAQGKDTVFAKLMVQADSPMTRKLEFGFSDQVKVFLNGKILFAGSDVFQSRDPIFLGTVGFHDAVYCRLERGSNEILLAVQESATISSGWGVQARLDNMSGITISSREQ